MTTQQDRTALTGNPIIRHKYTRNPAVLVYQDIVYMIELHGNIQTVEFSDFVEGSHLHKRGG